MTETTVEYRTEEARRTNGRTPPPLPMVTLPDSGYTIEYRGLGPLTMQALSTAVRTALPAPEPPLNTVTGLDGQEHQEPNTADPDHLAALTEYENRIVAAMADKMFDVIARRAIATPVDTDAVAQVRADFAGILELPEDDRDVWLRHVLISSTQDLMTLQAAILRRSQPTEEAIQDKVAEFPSDVSES